MPTTLEHVPRTVNVDGAERLAFSPDSGQAGHVEHDVPIAASVPNGWGVSNVSLYGRNARAFKTRIPPTTQNANVVAASEQHFDNTSAEKPTSTRYESVHRSRLAAHLARLSRLIFAL